MGCKPPRTGTATCGARKKPQSCASSSLVSSSTDSFGGSCSMLPTDSSPSSVDWSMSPLVLFTPPADTYLASLLSTLRSATNSAGQPLKTTLVSFLLLVLAGNPRVEIRMLEEFPYFSVDPAEGEQFQWLCMLCKDLQNDIIRQVKTGQKLEPVARQVIGESKAVSAVFREKIHKFREVAAILAIEQSDHAFVQTMKAAGALGILR